MSINSDWNGGAGPPFARSAVQFHLHAGQSNAGGGSNAKFETDILAHDADDDLLYSIKHDAGGNQAWGDIRGCPTTERFGAGPQFLRRMFDQDEKTWCSMTYCRTGQGMESGGPDSGWLTGTSLEDTNCLAVLDDFGELLGYAGGHANPIHLDLFSWYQGETDASTQAVADRYKQNFYELVSRMNAKLITWDFLVLIKINSIGYGDRVGFDEVNDALDEIAAELDNCVVIDTESASMDGVIPSSHHDSEGQLLVGERAFQAYYNATRLPVV